MTIHPVELSPLLAYLEDLDQSNTASVFIAKKPLQIAAKVICTWYSMFRVPMEEPFEPGSKVVRNRL